MMTEANMAETTRVRETERERKRQVEDNKDVVRKSRAKRRQRI